MNEKISGVYKITNDITGDCYIGSSRNIKHRWAVHKCPSTWKKCPNSRMYQDMAQFGLSCFLFEIVEETDNLKEQEQYWIDQLNPTYNSIRANGWDFERYKEWNKSHREEMIARCKEWKETHREEFRAGHKKCNNKLCLYEGEILKLVTLSGRFYKQSIPHAWLEAKKYLL